MEEAVDGEEAEGEQVVVVESRSLLRRFAVILDQYRLQ